MIKPLLDVGHKNYIFPDTITIILNPNSQPAKRVITDAKSDNRIFDVSRGKKTKSVIVLTTGEVVLSTLSTLALKKRYHKYIDKVNGLVVVIDDTKGETDEE